jgi:hypothetical protein
MRLKNILKTSVGIRCNSKKTSVDIYLKDIIANGENKKRNLFSNLKDYKSIFSEKLFRNHEKKIIIKKTFNQ